MLRADLRGFLRRNEWDPYNYRVQNDLGIDEMYFRNVSIISMKFWKKWVLRNKLMFKKSERCFMNEYWFTWWANPLKLYLVTQRHWTTCFAKYQPVYSSDWVLRVSSNQRTKTEYINSRYQALHKFLVKCSIIFSFTKGTNQNF